MKSTLPAYVALAMSLSSCAGWQAHRDGEFRLSQGDLEGGLDKLAQATKEAPGNVKYRQDLAKRKESALFELLDAAQKLVDLEQFDQARQLYEKALIIDRSNASAQLGLKKLDQTRKHVALRASATDRQRAGDLVGARLILEEVLREDPYDRKARNQLATLNAKSKDTQSSRISPRLREAYRKPVTLEVRDSTLQQIFDSLKQVTRLNFIFDRDVRTDVRISASLTNKPFEDVLKLVLAGQRLERKVLDEDTLLIYPATAEKIRDYQELVIRTFYLGNADAGKAMTVAKSLVKVRDAHVDERLNLLIVRDTPEQIRVLEKLLVNIDAEEPEVMLELEVLEIAANKLRTLGIQFPDSLTVSAGGAAGPGQLTLPEWRSRNSGMLNFSFSNPLMALNLKQTAGDNNLLANPRIRVKNKQTARVLVGERVPVITTTTTANVGTSESVSYLDVGLKLELEPLISIDDEVSMKVSLEVSNIIDVVTRSSGLQAFRLGTRNTSTTLRVRDGETQILAGLIQLEDRRSTAGVPGVSDLPILGRLFSSVNSTDSRTEIVLLITPRVVRNVTPASADQLEISAGTESSSNPLARQGVGTGISGGQVGGGYPQGLNPSDPNQPRPGTPFGGQPQPLVSPNRPAGVISPPSSPLNAPGIVPSSPGANPSGSR